MFRVEAKVSPFLVQLNVNGGVPSATLATRLTDVPEPIGAAGAPPIVTDGFGLVVNIVPANAFCAAGPTPLSVTVTKKSNIPATAVPGEIDSAVSPVVQEKA